jgi:uncharacterized protein YjbI with pentapeptide repeats
MANQEHADLLKQGVGVWNPWRKEHPDIEPDLKGVGLPGASLSGFDFSEVDFSGAELSGANFCTSGGLFPDKKGLIHKYVQPYRSGKAALQRFHAQAQLGEATIFSVWGTCLSGANFSGASLLYTNLTHADLRGVNFSQADLTGADLTGADLNGADLNGARAGSTKFNDLDLRLTKGLETIRHGAPSSIGIDTIIRSGGNISEAFLRGVGVPNTWITYSRSLISSPIDYYTCFISYSSKDEAFANA